MKTVVVPLDNRPCNHAWVKKYAAMAGVDLAIFPFEKSGDLHHGLDHDALLPWLDNELDDADYLIVSADALTSGGLIQAREAAFTLEDALERISAILSLKRRHPYLKLYVMDTIMRTTVTTKDESSRKHWANVNAYSRALGMAHLNGGTHWAEEAERLRNIIPDDILATYHEARRKKHILNQYMVNLVSFSDIDHLLLLQEDATDKGIQTMENDILRNMVDTLSVGEKVTMSNGTDEGTLVLFARMLLETMEHRPRVRVILPDDALKEVVMPFEDRPLWENITHTAEAIGLELTEAADADVVAAVFAEEHPRRFSLTEEATHEPTRNQAYQSFITTVNRAIRDRKDVVLIDLLHANGGSKNLLDDIDHRGLLAYSAWNTATNALGSALALIAVHAYAGDADMEDFLLERIIDDCLYQSHVRIDVNQRLLAQNKNIHDLGGDADVILPRIAEGLKHLAEAYTDRPFTVSLPWDRTFEIDIDMEE